MNLFLSADLLAVAIARHYEQRFGSSVVSIGYAPKYDIRFADGTTFEIKFDGLAAVTGSAAVEYWNKKSGASGILTTEAKLWVHAIPENGSIRCFEIETKKLLKLVIESGQVKDGGNRNESLLKLIPLQSLKDISSDDFLLRGELVDLVRQSVLQE